jgi:hypothetical protein
MEISKRINLTSLALLLIAVHLSSGYAPIFKAAMMGSYEERAQYIHDARVAVRTDKDREIEAKLEKMQENFSGGLSRSNCPTVESISRLPLASFTVAYTALAKCQEAAEESQQVAGVRLRSELRATAGLPLN